MGTMNEDIPTELTTEVGSLLKIIINSVRCSSCLNIICEPQKGSCAHNACAKCWGSSGRKCKVCKANSGVQLVPNNDLSSRVTAVMKLVKSFQEWSKIDVLSNDSSNDTEISNQKDVALNECFYEKDVKYMNMKTYKGKPKPKISKKKGKFNEEEFIEDIYSDSNQSVIKKSNIDAKVDSWLSSPVNKFSHIPKNNMLKKTNKQSVEGDDDTNKVHNLSEKDDKPDVNSKTHNKSNESVPSKSESKTKTEWIDVKKCKKTLQKGKKEKKKLSVSVESCSKNISNTDVNNQPNSFHIIEDVSTPKRDICEDIIVIESNDFETNINKNQIVSECDNSKKFIEINNIENNVIENFNKIESVSMLEKPHMSENIKTPCDVNFSQKNRVFNDCLYSERIKIPFFYSGKLSSKTAKHSKRKVPFNFEISSKSNKWFKTTEDGLNIKIQRENSITSIIIQEGSIQHVANKTKTTGTQTSPDCFKNIDTRVVSERTENELNPSYIKPKNIYATISSESAKSNNICNEMENDVQILSDNDFVVNPSIGNDTFSRNKRMRIDTSNNDLDYSNPTKKNKLSISDMPVDENMVVCFDSQSQIFNSEDLNKSEMEKKSSGKNLGLENSEMTRHKSKVDISIPNDSGNDEKLSALKKSIEMYVGNKNISDSKKKSFLTSVSNGQIDINKDVLEDIGVSQIPVDCEKQIDEEPHTPYSVIEGDAIVEDTPQKSRTRRIAKRNSTRNSSLKENVNTLNSSISKNLRSHDVSKPTSNISKEKNDSDMDETLVCESVNKLNENKLSVKKKIITPSSINKFKHDVKHQSTPLQPLAKRSLTYDTIGKCPTIGEEEEVHEKHSLSRSHSCHAQSLLEKEFIDEAFEYTVGKKIEGKKNDSEKNVSNTGKKSNVVSGKRKLKKMCLVCSLLSISEKNFIETISKEMGWDYSSTFTRDLSHLIVKVDADNKTQRTEKYIRALASGCWIVSFEWIEQCIKAKRHVPEDAFEVLDSGGDRGPYLMRTSETKLFQDVTFYLLPPFELLPIGILEEIILSTGGKVVKTMKEAFVTDPNKISIVLIEVKDTQEDRFIDMCLQHPLVPVNVEWVLESLGRGNRNSLGNWILSHQSVLPKIDWPGDLFSDDEFNTSS